MPYVLYNSNPVTTVTPRMHARTPPPTYRQHIDVLRTHVVSVVDATTIMKRHIGRHCGVVLDTWRVKQHHLSINTRIRRHLQQWRHLTSPATRLASFQKFHPSMRHSFSTVDHNVVFGRQTFLLSSGVQVNAVSHLLLLSIRRICPTHFYLLNLSSVLIVFNFVFARIP